LASSTTSIDGRRFLKKPDFQVRADGASIPDASFRRNVFRSSSRQPVTVTDDAFRAAVGAAAGGVGVDFAAAVVIAGLTFMTGDSTSDDVAKAGVTGADDVEERSATSTTPATTAMTPRAIAPWP
jgi:hypothetical protein